MMLTCYLGFNYRNNSAQLKIRRWLTRLWITSIGKIEIRHKPRRINCSLEESMNSDKSPIYVVTESGRWFNLNQWTIVWAPAKSKNSKPMCHEKISMEIITDGEALLKLWILYLLNIMEIK